jgi:SAM-dependent methyltransferase
MTRMAGWQRIKTSLALPAARRMAKLPVVRRLATPMVRRWLGRPLVRIELARKHLRGDGIEVGALHAPLWVPRGARVRYVDCAAGEVLRAIHWDVPTVTEPDLIGDLETLDCIADASVDFVIASHVLEHVENPLRALVTIGRVLRNGGIAYIALPDKRFTFDLARQNTPLWHIVRDFEEGPAWSRHGHYVDWAMNVEHAADVEAHAAHNERTAHSIHFHVWNFTAMREMFDFAVTMPQVTLTVVHGQEHGTEALWILRKS